MTKFYNCIYYKTQRKGRKNRETVIFKEDKGSKIPERINYIQVKKHKIYIYFLHHDKKNVLKFLRASIYLINTALRNTNFFQNLI